MLLNTLVFLHVLSAMVAVGINVSYFFWLRRSVLVQDSRVYTLETIRMLELRIATPAYVLLGLTGIWLVIESGREWSTPWIELSILLLVVILGVSGIHSRIIRRRIEIAGDEAAYQSDHRKSRILMAAMTLSILAALYLMVFEPTLWG